MSIGNLKQRMQRRNRKINDRHIKIKDSLITLNRLPTHHDVNQRRMYLQNINIGKRKEYFLSLIAKEVEETWKSQDMPVQNWNQIYIKLKRQKLSNTDDLFDCLPRKPVWKTNEEQSITFFKRTNLAVIAQQPRYLTKCILRKLLSSIHQIILL